MSDRFIFYFSMLQTTFYIFSTPSIEFKKFLIRLLIKIYDKLWSIQISMFIVCSKCKNVTIVEKHIDQPCEFHPTSTVASRP